MKLCVELDIFGKRDTRISRSAVLFFLTALARHNERLLAARRVPTLYSTKVVYRREPKGSENWRDAAIVYRDGFGDCEDLACYRVGELRAQGIAAEPYILWQGPKYHAAVRWPDGRIEDPSLALGMRNHPITRRPEFI